MRISLVLIGVFIFFQLQAQDFTYRKHDVVSFAPWKEVTFGRDQDRLPEKFFRKPLQGGPSDGIKLDPVELETALDEYYEQVGWEKTTGWPTSDTLKRLKLDWLIGTFDR